MDASEFINEYAEQAQIKLDNGKDKLQSVIDFLFHVDGGRLDDEDIAYGLLGECPFTYKDYDNVFYYLETQADGKIQSSMVDIFPEELAYFNLNGKKFVWRLLLGQGSAMQLLIPDEDFPYKQEFEVVL